jgi:RND family efflux transporter MFP subunit
MSRPAARRFLATALLAAPLVWTACSEANGKTSDTTPAVAVSVATAAAIEQPIARYIQATGSLTAEERADVAAETSGRIVATPVERGTRVAEGAELVRVSSAETAAQLQEAEANAAQIEARLGLPAGASLDVDGVPEVQFARASYSLAESEFSRIQSLLHEGVVSQSEFEQRRTQLEVARRQYEAARNGAAQQYQALQAARARVTLARKALADTAVRAPFNGVVAERAVSVGDYVTRGTLVAVVVRVNPLRVRLTIPEQFVSAVGVGQRVLFEVEAYPGRPFEGQVRYVSPALEAAQRALTVEAIVPNQHEELKPGLFATARIEQPGQTPGVVVPGAAVLTSAGTSRLFVVSDGRAEERIVTTGQTLDALVEITSGVTSGERVAITNLDQLADGTAVAPR